MHFRHLRVRLETERHVIEGTLQLPNEGYRSRMTDFLNSHDSDFLPVTDATLTARGDGAAPVEHEYLAVSVRHIVLGAELETLGRSTPPAGDRPSRCSSSPRRRRPSSAAGVPARGRRRLRACACFAVRIPRWTSRTSSLSEYVLGGAAARGDKPALIDGATGAVTTYAEFAGQVTRSAAGLAAEGIGPGDRVGLLGPNTPSWAVAFHAVVSLGAIVTPINPLLTPAEVAKQLGIAGARAVIVAEALRGALAESGIDEVHALDALPAGDGEPGAPAADPASDLAVLPFSSGTTGISKGVMLTHRNLVANMEQIRAVHRIGADDVLVGLLPFFHIYGQTVVVNLGLAQGATIVTMPRFDMGGFLDLLERHRVTRAHVAPPVVLGLAKAPGVEGRELALRVVISGAAPLDADTANRASERLGAPVRQGYGMTEASPVTHFAADEELEAQDPGAIGRLVGNTEGRLVDPETGEDADGDGEIWIRGPQVMRGYLGDEDATRETLTEDGWLRTGDVARLEEGDVWRIVDRVKELIKYKGYQVPRPSWRRCCSAIPTWPTRRSSRFPTRPAARRRRPASWPPETSSTLTR
jgi:acyl-CoA synthetase (AMP-forming)/AMP-acid ligase II